MSQDRTCLAYDNLGAIRYKLSQDRNIFVLEAKIYLMKIGVPNDGYSQNYISILLP